MRNLIGSLLLALVFTLPFAAVLLLWDNDPPQNPYLFEGDGETTIHDVDIPAGTWRMMYRTEIWRDTRASGLILIQATEGDCQGFINFWSDGATTETAEFISQGCRAKILVRNVRTVWALELILIQPRR